AGPPADLHRRQRKVETLRPLARAARGNRRGLIRAASSRRPGAVQLSADALISVSPFHTGTRASRCHLQSSDRTARGPVESDPMTPGDQDHLDLFLFTTDPAMAHRAEQAGVDGVVIDWETKNKAARQQGYDTDTGGDTLADLEAVVADISTMQVLVRVDA